MLLAVDTSKKTGRRKASQRRKMMLRMVVVAEQKSDRFAINCLQGRTDGLLSDENEQINEENEIQQGTLTMERETMKTKQGKEKEEKPEDALSKGEEMIFEIKQSDISRPCVFGSPHSTTLHLAPLFLSIAFVRVVLCCVVSCCVVLCCVVLSAPP